MASTVSPIARLAADLKAIERAVSSGHCEPSNRSKLREAVLKYWAVAVLSESLEVLPCA